MKRANRNQNSESPSERSPSLYARECYKASPSSPPLPGSAMAWAVLCGAPLSLRRQSLPESSEVYGEGPLSLEQAAREG